MGRRIDPVVVVALAAVALHAAVAGRYGFHGDELVLAAAGQRPQWGYPALAPLAPALTRGLAEVVGGGIVPLRLAAGAVHGALVLVAGRWARRWGAGSTGQVLAAAAVATGLPYLAMGSTLTPDGLGALWWAAALGVVVAVQTGSSPRWWPLFGVALGLGLMTSWSLAPLAGGVLAASVVTSAGRRWWRAPGWWASWAIAAAIWAPNLAWESANGRPTALAVANSRAWGARQHDQITYLPTLLVTLGPVLVVLAAVGLWWLGRRSPLRPVAVAVLAGVALGVVAGDRPGPAMAGLLVALAAAGPALDPVGAGPPAHGVAPATPTRRNLPGEGDHDEGDHDEGDHDDGEHAGAAGGPAPGRAGRGDAGAPLRDRGFEADAEVEAPARAAVLRAHRRRVAVALVALAIPNVALSVPILPVEAMLALKLDKPNDGFAEQLGWEELTEATVTAVRSLPPHEQDSLTVIAGTDAVAAALQRFGPARGLDAERVVSGRNAYGGWWPDDRPAGAVLSVRIEPSVMAPLCTSLEELGRIDNRHGAHNEVRGAAILRCVEPLRSPAGFRAALRLLLA